MVPTVNYVAEYFGIGVLPHSFTRCGAHPKYMHVQSPLLRTHWRRVREAPKSPSARAEESARVENNEWIAAFMGKMISHKL